MRNPKLTYSLVVLLAVSWFIFSLLPAYWASRGDFLWAAMGRKWLSVVCHQLPSRSFSLWGQPLALCARCTGIYGGLIVGLILYPFVRALGRTDLPSRIYLLLALGPMFVDFLLGLFHLVENTHLSRSLTGAIAGAGLAFYIVPATVCLVQDLSRAVAKAKS
jgi:uncharacterized membrane protein